MLKILLVEDDPDILDNLKTFLENEGFEIVTAENGDLALKLLKSITPDLIISDIMMPIVDGYELLKKIKNNIRLDSIPFIVLTAKSDIVSFRKVMDIGADDYLIKPFDFQEVMDTIKLRLKKNNIKI